MTQQREYLSILKEKIYHIATPNQLTKISTPEQIAKRKIYRLKTIQERQKNLVRSRTSSIEDQSKANKHKQKSQSFSENKQHERPINNQEIEEDHNYNHTSRGNTKQLTNNVNSIERDYYFDYTYSRQESRINTKKSYESKKVEKQNHDDQINQLQQKNQIQSCNVIKENNVPVENTPQKEKNQVNNTVVLPFQIKVQKQTKNSILETIFTKKLPEQSTLQQEDAQTLIKKMFKRQTNQANTQKKPDQKYNDFSNIKLTLKPKSPSNPILFPIIKSASPSENPFLLKQKQQNPFILFKAKQNDSKTLFPNSGESNKLQLNFLFTKQPTSPNLGSNNATNTQVNKSTIFPPNTSSDVQNSAEETSKIQDNKDSEQIPNQVPENEQQSESYQQSESHEQSKSEQKVVLDTNKKNCLFRREANKFRKNTQTLDVIENIYVSIEQIQDKYHIIIRSISTKTIQYQGLILEKSKIEYLNKQQKNVKIFPLISENEKTGKLQQDTLKIQFKDNNTGIQFQQKFNSIFHKTHL